MMIGLMKFLFWGMIFLSVSAGAYEGPFATDGSPWTRVSSNGSFSIYPMPASAGCYDDKVSVANTGDTEMKSMVMSLVLAAQMSGRKLNIWVERYDSTSPQRCEMAFIEID
ncbi:hypothetical protein [uncultured Microbulbifer sp.]|uniref:hypothetical protein n=1 Tax=uncultured Microbulbifer sp. TaxID=348147 RepID=UPI002628E6CE|nr:hypothetical protein [uncultured Microbulbifer sp.]